MLKDILDKMSTFNQAAQREKIQSPEIIQKTKAVRFPAAVTATADLWLFEVQAAANAAGIYLCYIQTTFGVFEPPEIEVFNLFENNTIEDPTPALAVGDKIAAWQMLDDESNLRWVGIAVEPAMRIAKATENAGAEQHITCNLIASDGVTEITSGLGAGIEVYFKANLLTDFPDWKLEEVAPLLQADDPIPVVNIAGKWWCETLFSQSESKPC